MIMMLAMGLSYMAFVMLRHILSLPPFWRFFFFYHKWILNFVKIFVSSIEMTMIFILQFVNVVYHTDQFADIEVSLQL